MWTITIVLLFGLAGVIALFVMQSRRPAVPEPHVATEEEVEQVVAQASSIMPDLIVKRIYTPIIDQDRRDMLTWLVEVKKTDEHFFPVTRYEINLGGFDYDKLDEAINRAYATHNSFPDIEANLGFGSFVTGGVSTSAKKLLELAGVIHEIVELKVDHIDIAVKGYADGEKSPEWRRKLQPLPQEYRAFPILRAADEALVNWTFYKKSEQQRTVPELYTNGDLPDLRAQFLKRELVNEVLKRSPYRDRCRVYVLHSKPVDDVVDHPELRKAQVYVMVYLARDEKSS